jgi:threonine dehydratase
VLDEMWPLVRELVADSLVVSLDDVAAGVRLLAGRNRVIAEGGGAAGVAAAVNGLAGEGKVICIVSGGNINLATLATILSAGA